MPDRPNQQGVGPGTTPPTPPDADTVPITDPTPIPGAAGPMGGSPTDDLVDGVDQPIHLPGDRPPLATD